MPKTTNKRAARGWMMYDFASQPFHTLIFTFIFAPYFTSAVMGDAAEGQAIWGYTVGITGVVIALAAPFLGAIADSAGPRMPWMATFAVLYVIGNGALWFAVPGMENVTLILLAVAIGMIGVEFSTTFNNAMLPDIAAKDDIGRVSGNGWGFGYIGGLLALILVLTLVAENDQGVTLIGISPIGGLDAEMREGTRAVGPITAIWFVIFMIPFFRMVPDVPRKPRADNAVRDGIRALFATIRALPQKGNWARYLLASMIYRDALVGLFAFGGIYAAGVLGLSVVQVGIFGIIAAAAGALGAWFGGRMDNRHGPRPILITTICVLILVCALVVATSRVSILGIPIAEGSSMPEVIFYTCGALIGASAGALQAASRTMVVRLASPDRMTEAFGLYSLSGKATAFVAPLSIAVATDLSGSQQIGISPIVILFLIGLGLLLFVRHDETNPG